MAIQTHGFGVDVLPQYTPIDPQAAGGNLGTLIPQGLNTYGQVGALKELASQRAEDDLIKQGRIARINAENQLATLKAGALSQIVPQMTEATKTTAEATTAQNETAKKLAPGDLWLKLNDQELAQKLSGVTNTIAELKAKNTESSLQLAQQLEPLNKEIAVAQANINAITAKAQQDWHQQYGRDMTDTELNAAFLHNKAAQKEAQRLSDLYDQIRPAMDALDTAKVGASIAKEHMLIQHPELNFPQVAAASLRAVGHESTAERLLETKASAIGLPSTIYKRLSDMGFGADLAGMSRRAQLYGFISPPKPGTKFEKAWNALVLGEGDPEYVKAGAKAIMRLENGKVVEHSDGENDYLKITGSPVLGK